MRLFSTMAGTPFSFGELVRESGILAKANPFRFSTKYQDEETGLLYYGYRYLDVGTGRWLSRDPIEEEGGLSLYGLLGNDSVNKLDLLGMASPCDLIRQRIKNLQNRISYKAT